MTCKRVTAKGYIFDYIYLVSLAFPDGDIWTETLFNVDPEYRSELMLGISAPNEVTYFGIVRDMSVSNILEDYDWEILQTND